MYDCRYCSAERATNPTRGGGHERGGFVCGTGCPNDKTGQMESRPKPGGHRFNNIT